MKKDNSRDNIKTSYIFTRETMGMTLILFSAIVLLMLFSGSSIFAGLGSAICTFMYGTFGYGSILITLLLGYFGEWLVFEKKIKLPIKYVLLSSLAVIALFLLFQTVSTRGYELTTFGQYLSDCYYNAELGFSGYTVGGVICGIVVFPIAKGMGLVVAYVVFAVLALACTFFAAYFIVKSVREKNDNRRRDMAEQMVESSAALTDVESPIKTQSVNITPVDHLYVETERGEIINTKAPVTNFAANTVDYNQPQDTFSQQEHAKKILFEKGEFAAESYKRNLIFSDDSYFKNPVTTKDDYLSSFSNERKQKSYTESYQDEVSARTEPPIPSSYIYSEKPVERIDELTDSTPTVPFGISNETSYTENYTHREQPVPPPEVPYQKPAENYSSNYSNDEHIQTPSNSFSEPTESVNNLPNEINNFNEEVSPLPERAVGFYDSGVNDSVEKDNEPPAMPERESGAIDIPERGIRSNANLFDDDAEDDPFSDILRTDRSSDVNSLNRGESGLRSDNLNLNENRENRSIVPPANPISPIPSARDLRGGVNSVSQNTPTSQSAPQSTPTPEEPKPKHVWKKYVAPEMNLLRDYPENNNVNTTEIEDNKRAIIETFANLKIETEIPNVTIGPAVTRYDVAIKDMTNINRSLKYRDNVAMALRKKNVTAYLNFSKRALSIEVPNNKRTVVGLKTMLASSTFINSKNGALVFGLGKNVDGDVMCPDITKMPHLLVAGTTGSGKSICLSSLIISLLYKYGPEELRLILVDPKQVEFISYDKLPHLMINEIIFDVNKAIKALNWAITEMERRYTLFKDMTEAGTATKNLDEYNAHLPKDAEKLPKIVIVLDEFGDLMLQAKKDIEGRIIKLVQKARACGIHLILATQRPSVDCITGLIKSNLPTRIGFKVNSFDDSRTIFDIGGAEKLLGRGDMYFRSADNPELMRLQGCFIDTDEVQAVTDFIKSHNESYFDQSVYDYINKVEEEPANAPSFGDGLEEVNTKIDDTFIKALKYCVNSNQASVSMIQRRFPVGYLKACKIIDWMENMNYITQSEGSKPRKVLLSKDEFSNTYGDIDD